MLEAGCVCELVGQGQGSRGNFSRRPQEVNNSFRSRRMAGVSGRKDGLMEKSGTFHGGLALAGKGRG